MRIAKRRSIHIESALAKCTPLDAEMRRRLWWALASLDHRIAEMSEYTTTSLVPTWDCRVPANLNDFELRADMKRLSDGHGHPTEAIFTCIRSQLCDRLRRCQFHLDFVNPTAGKQTTMTEVDALENALDLSQYDDADPLHFMTLFTTRGACEKLRLYEYYAGQASKPSDLQRNAAVAAATRAIQHDITLRTSPLGKQFLWYTDFFFPGLAYVHLLKELPRRPLQEHSGEAWAVMNAHYEVVAARQANCVGNEHGGLYRFYITFGKAIVRAWERRDAALQVFLYPAEPTPCMVTEIRTNVLMEPSTSGETPPSDQPMPATPAEYVDASVPEVSFSQPPSREGEILDVDMDKFWSEIDWHWMQRSSEE